MKRILLLATICCLFFSSMHAQLSITPAAPTIPCGGSAVLTASPSCMDNLMTLPDDIYSGSLPIGFNFNFYGTTYNNFLISSNGYICFNLANAGAFSSWPISSGIFTNPDIANSVAGLFTDIYIPAGGTISYGLRGVAPNRKLVVSFCNCALFSCTSQTTTFQIELFETSNIIEVHISNRSVCTSWNGGAGIVGVENASTTAGTAAPGRNYPPGTWTVTVPEAYRFTPNPGYTSYAVSTIPFNAEPSCTISWYKSGAFIGSGSSITVSPAATTTYQAVSTRCDGTTSSAFATVTVTPPAVAGTITGPTPVCGGTAAAYASSGTPGGVWSSTNPGLAPINSSTGAVTFGNPATATTVTIKYTVTTACGSSVATKNVVINPSPAIYSVTGGGSYCAGGAGLSIGLSGSQVGVNYTLYNGGTPVAGPIAGTGSSFNFGLFTMGGTYTVQAANATTACSRAMAGSRTITVDPIPVITGTLTVCESSTTILSASVSGGTWSSSDPSVASVPSGTGSPVTVTGVAFGTADITYTTPAGCVQRSTVTVNPTPVASVSSSPSVICAGFCTTLTATYTFTGAGAISYSWVPVSSASSTISDCPTVTTTYYVTVTESNWSCSSTAATTVTVNPLPVISGTLQFCDGSTTTLTSSIGGDTWSSSDPSVATIPSGPSGSEVVTSVSPGTSVITDISPAGCISTVTITVDPTAFVTSVTAAPSTICAGDPTMLNVTYSGSPVPVITWSPGGMVGTPVVDFPMTNTTYNVTTTLGSCTSTGTVMVSVNPTPAIVGPTNLCLSSYVMLYPTIGGGTWTNMTPGVISVISAVGDTVKVTGLMAGTGTIKYTLPTGCFAMITVTVFPTPAPVVTLNTPGTDPTVSPYAYRIDANGPCIGYTVQYRVHLNNWPATTKTPTQIMNSPGPHYGIYYDYPLNAPFPLPPYDFTLLLPDTTFPRMPGYPGGWWGIYQVDLLNVSTILTPQSPPNCACTWDISSTLTWKSAHANANVEQVDAAVTTNLSISPNPTAGVFSISGTLQPGVKSTEVAVEVLDAIGRVIYTDVATINKGNINKQITLGSDIANGIYLVRIKNSEVSKVVKFTLER